MPSRAKKAHNLKKTSTIFSGNQKVTVILQKHKKSEKDIYKNEIYSEVAIMNIFERIQIIWSRKLLRIFSNSVPFYGNCAKLHMKILRRE